VHMYLPGAIQLYFSTCRSSADHDIARFVGPVLSNWALPVIICVFVGEPCQIDGASALKSVALQVSKGTCHTLRSQS